ncbi:MAG: 6-carboxytetrahydropterin synthase QueD [Candidatus Omnitrophica bacterium CG11_big_fil_rev_8_21_14_0_20_42_13]|uniref:6-carboxy-5,6,7,8-tetrahydropterin synthase n=1 Tax=Candidatus Ghiorseimicrobium undicola TaxID=1974746 RepID=A0A2H0LY57_9BACT|nr:MAG: 6-carboxytetrahydropterin synthase QueD [Candidatus Omnitrophica bacterium CG11_big_fil_rev_8_21_14_0_20_42_13]
MFEVKVISDFSAAHSLREYKGQCEELHGHNWKVEVSVSSLGLDKLGLVIDFRKLKRQLKPILNLLDHKHINKLSYFKKTNPSSENIAKFIYEKLASRIGTEFIMLKVTVWENERSSATYYNEI